MHHVDHMPKGKSVTGRDWHYDMLLKEFDGVGCKMGEIGWNEDGITKQHDKGCKRHKECERAWEVRKFVHSMISLDKSACVAVDCCAPAERNVNGLDLCRSHANGEVHMLTHGQKMNGVLEARDRMAKLGERAEKAVWKLQMSVTDEAGKMACREALAALKEMRSGGMRHG